VAVAELKSMQTHPKTLRIPALSWPLTFLRESTMFNFWKKRREAEQQRKFEAVMDAHEAVLALYEPARPATLQDELAAVKASFERGLSDDQG